MPTVDVTNHSWPCRLSECILPSALPRSESWKRYSLYQIIQHLPSLKINLCKKRINMQCPDHVSLVIFKRTIYVIVTVNMVLCVRHRYNDVEGFLSSIEMNK